MVLRILSNGWLAGLFSQTFEEIIGFDSFGATGILTVSLMASAFVCFEDLFLTFLWFLS